MDENKINSTFSQATLQDLFPQSRTENFFEALFGDNEEGAYDIRLGYLGFTPDGSVLNFALELHERPGRCLACNLTQGLPQVFSRHPIIDIKGLVNNIVNQLGTEVRCEEWQLGRTKQQAGNLHIIPLTITLA